MFVAYSLLLKYGQLRIDYFKCPTNWRRLLPLSQDVIWHVEDGYFGQDDDGTGLIPIEVRLRYPVVFFLYEISRAHKLHQDDLQAFDSSFLDHLFDLVEWTRDESDDTFNYTLVKLLTSLNEQYMIRNIETSVAHSQHLQISNNLVLNVLTRRLGSSKTFGENLIFILNRARDSKEDVCVKLLVLKILFLLFTTVGTQDYFYTNDLKVLVDVFIRELSDLPDEQEGVSAMRLERFITDCAHLAPTHISQSSLSSVKRDSCERLPIQNYRDPQHTYWTDINKSARCQSYNIQISTEMLIF